MTRPEETHGGLSLTNVRTLLSRHSHSHRFRKRTGVGPPGKYKIVVDLMVNARLSARLSQPGL